MSFAIVGAVVAGGAGLVGAVGGAALGAAGAIGSLGVSAASGLVSGVGGLVSGAGGLLFPAAGVTVGESMAAIAQPAYYEAAGAGILGGIIPAATQTVGFLGEIAPAAAGIYSLIKPPQTADIPIAPSRAPVPAVPAPAIAKSALPIFGQQPAQVMTVGGTAKTAGPNYMIYIVLAIVAYFLLRKR